MDQRNLAPVTDHCELQDQNTANGRELKNGGKLPTHACIHLATQFQGFALNWWSMGYTKTNVECIQLLCN